MKKLIRRCGCLTENSENCGDLANHEYFYTDSELKKMQTKEIKAKDLDKKFDEGEDMTPYVDYSSVRRPAQKPTKGSFITTFVVNDSMNKIAYEAGEIFHETGLTPRELKEHREKLLLLLQRLISAPGYKEGKESLPWMFIDEIKTAIESVAIGEKS